MVRCGTISERSIQIHTSYCLETRKMLVLATFWPLIPKLWPNNPENESKPSSCGFKHCGIISEQLKYLYTSYYPETKKMLVLGP